jgi:hypothetical protein
MAVTAAKRIGCANICFRHCSRRERAMKPSVIALAALVLVALGSGEHATSETDAGADAMASTREVFTYRTDGSGQFDAHFVSSDDTFVVTEADTAWDRSLRFFSSRGELLSETPLAKYRTTRALLLADERHLVFPLLDSRQYELVPADGNPSRSAVEVLAWIEGAHGLRNNGFADLATTNAYANVSCAVGENGSIATWRLGVEGSLQVSSPGAIAVVAPRIRSIQCLATADDIFVLVFAIDSALPPAERAIVSVYSAGQDAPRQQFSLGVDGQALDTSFSLVGPATIAGVGALVSVDAVAPAQQFGTRISIVDHEWRVEHVRLDRWPSDVQQLNAGARAILASIAPYPNDLFRVTWPLHASSLPFEATRIRVPDDDFYRDVLRAGALRQSPSGAHGLWIGSTGELRLVRLGNDDLGGE